MQIELSFHTTKLRMKGIPYEPERTGDVARTIIKVRPRDARRTDGGRDRNTVIAVDASRTEIKPDRFRPTLRRVDGRHAWLSRAGSADRFILSRLRAAPKEDRLRRISSRVNGATPSSAIVLLRNSSMIASDDPLSRALRMALSIIPPPFRPPAPARSNASRPGVGLCG